MIDLAELRALPVVAPSADSTTRWVPFVEVPVDVLAALTDAVEADLALVAAEERGINLGPEEHRKLIALHDRALAKFGSAQ